MTRLVCVLSLFLCLVLPHVSQGDPDPAQPGNSSATPSTASRPKVFGANSNAPMPAANQAFDEVMQQLLTRHIDKGLTTDELYQAAIEGMLRHASLELAGARDRSENDAQPSNALLSPERLEGLRTSLTGRRCGIGCRIDVLMNPGRLDVLGVFRNSPAEKAGLRAGDHIIAIDNQSVVHMTSRDMGAMLAGPQGSTVTLTVQRSDPAQELRLPIVRDAITIESASGELLPPDIGLLQIHMFSDQTPSEVQGILLELRGRAIKGLIVDLRDNAGGKLDAGIQVLELFVPRGTPLVQLENREGRRETYIARGQPILNVPVVVLMGYRTISSAEVVADALRRHLGAQLVGEQSYGKATVEEILPLRNGYATKISIQRIVPLSGETWEERGLTPDITIKSDSESVKRSLTVRTLQERLRLDPPLNRAVKVLMKK